MGQLEPYTLQQAQELVKDSLQRSTTRHGMWRALEHLYRTGQVLDRIEPRDVPDRLWTDLPGLTVDGINLTLPNMQIIMMTAMQHDPGFVVEPFTGGEESEQGARMGEELLKYFWKRLDGSEVARQMVQDFVLLGSGFARVGWRYVEEPRDRDDDEIREELASLIGAERRDAILGNRRERDPEELFDLIQTVETRATADEPYIEYVSPYDVFVPVNARRLEEARWIAHRMVLPYDEVVNNEAFSNVDQLEPASRSDRPQLRGGADEQARLQGESGNNVEDPFAEVTLYEFYDMRTRTMLVFQEDGREPLYEGELPYSHRYPPIVHMRNFEDGGNRFWPFGDLENVAALQAQFNEFVSEQLSNAIRSGNKYAVDEDALDEDWRELLTSEESDVVVPVRLGQRNVEDVIQVLQRHPTSPEVFEAKNELVARMRDVLGLNDFQAGGSGADRMSATAAAVVDGTATLRATDKNHQVERAVGRLGTQVLLLCQEYLDTEQALRIVGPEGQVAWLEASRADLVGEFGVSVESGSTQAVNPATRQEKAIEMMTAIIPVITEAGYDPHPMWRHALREYGLDPDRFLQAAPQPEMPEMAPPPEGGEGQGHHTPDAVDGGGGTPHETVPQERLGGPPVPAAVDGGLAL